MNNFAHLKEDSPFYDLFPPSGLVPITNVLLPNRAELETPDGAKVEEVFMVDLKKIGDELLMKIATRIATKAKVDPMVVFHELKERGLPLRASQTTGCSTDSRHFL